MNSNAPVTDHQPHGRGPSPLGRGIAFGIVKL